MTVLREGGPNILWLEDRHQTASAELREVGRLGYTVVLRAHPLELMAFLEERLGKAYSHDRCAALRLVFIVDVMIAGLYLPDLGIEPSGMGGGLNGGYVFVDRILRRPGSPHRFCPVFFLSERQLTPDLQEDLNYLRERRDEDGTAHGTVEYIRKYDSAELDRFRAFIRKL